MYDIYSANLRNVTGVVEGFGQQPHGFVIEFD